MRRFKSLQTLRAERVHCARYRQHVRRACHVDGMNKSAAGRLFGIDRKTVAKILKHSVRPGYRRATAPLRPKLDPFIPVIDQILEDDKRVIKKQRHTAKRIFERLRDEHGFASGITIVTDKEKTMKQRRLINQKRVA